MPEATQPMCGRAGIWSRADSVDMPPPPCHSRSSPDAAERQTAASVLGPGSGVSQGMLGGAQGQGIQQTVKDTARA